jgi:hypothetical protein
MDDVETGAYSLVLSLQDAATGAAAGEPYVLQEIVVQDDVSLGNRFYFHLFVVGPRS